MKMRFFLWWGLMAAVGGCAVAPRGFTRSNHVSTVSVLPNGESVVLGAMLHGEVRLAPLHLDARQRWSSGPTGPERVGHAAATLQDGRILVCGGLQSRSGRLESAKVSLYDPAVRSWQAATPMHAHRHHATAALLNDGRVLVHGGTDGAPGAPRSEAYNPATGTWKVVEDVDPCEGSGQLVGLRDGRALLISGGCAATFEPRKDRWKQVAAPRYTHRGGTVTALTDGRVIVVGGNGDDRAARATEFFDPRTSAWVDGPTLTHGRWAHSTTQVGDVLVVAGGRRKGPEPDRRMHSVELFNLRNGKRGRKALGVRRSGHVAVASDGGLTLVGGSVGMIFNNFPSHRAVRLRLPRRTATRTSPTPTGR